MFATLTSVLVWGSDRLHYLPGNGYHSNDNKTFGKQRSAPTPAGFTINMFTGDGSWGAWQQWSSCGRGTRSRTRRCDSPLPNICGRSCSGESVEREECDEPRPPCGNFFFLNQDFTLVFLYHTHLLIINSGVSQP